MIEYHAKEEMEKDIDENKMKEENIIKDEVSEQEANKQNENNVPKKKKKFTVLIIVIIIEIAFVVGGLFFCYYQATMDQGSIDKPIIYIYPTQETEVAVKLEKPEYLTCTYPKYEEKGWKVIAKPDGTLIDKQTGRELYSLYWEGKNSIKLKIEKEGFCIKGENTASFLEEKLSLLGLNAKEQKEFIVYWLPKLEKNKYNYIRFATEEEINENMPIQVTPKPDTIIRVLMVWKGMQKPIEVEKQQLKTPTRTGFTVVEWGGTEL